VLGRAVKASPRSPRRGTPRCAGPSGCPAVRRPRRRGSAWGAGARGRAAAGN